VQISGFLPQLGVRSFQRSKQNERFANVWRKRDYLDGQIDWRMSAQSIYNLVRGLAKPYVGAHCLVDGEVVKVWKVTVVKDSPVNAEPGKVLLQANGQFVVKCGADAISLQDTDPELNLDIGVYL
jgi:methionyl-tRNA formyltransferase